MLQEFEEGIRVFLMAHREAEGEDSEQQLLKRWESRLQLTQVRHTERQVFLPKAARQSYPCRPTAQML